MEEAEAGAEEAGVVVAEAEEAAARRAGVVVAEAEAEEAARQAELSRRRSTASRGSS